MARCGVGNAVSNFVFRRWLSKNGHDGVAYVQSSNFTPEQRTESLLRGVFEGKRAKLAEAITLGETNRASDV